MQFIKATDRLPDDGFNKFLMVTGGMAIGNYRKDKGIFISNGEYYEPKLVEWLDVKATADGNERIRQFFNRVHLADAIEGFSDFYNNHKNVDPPKSLRTIIQEYVSSLGDI